MGLKQSLAEVWESHLLAQTRLFITEKETVVPEDIYFTILRRLELPHWAMLDSFFLTITYHSDMSTSHTELWVEARGVLKGN